MFLDGIISQNIGYLDYNLTLLESSVNTSYKLFKHASLVYGYLVIIFYVNMWFQ